MCCTFPLISCTFQLILRSLDATPPHLDFLLRLGGSVWTHGSLQFLYNSLRWLCSARFRDCIMLFERLQNHFLSGVCFGPAFVLKCVISHTHIFCIGHLGHLFWRSCVSFCTWGHPGDRGSSREDMRWSIIRFVAFCCGTEWYKLVCF